MQIHNRATRLDQVSSRIGTRGQSVPQELFVFRDEVLELTFLRGESVELGNVEFAETFDVDRASVLRGRLLVEADEGAWRRRTLSILW
jgi:hypothetical protein